MHTPPPPREEHAIVHTLGGYTLAEAGKVTLKSNGDEAFSDEFLLRRNSDKALSDNLL
jgi:hypothetical protein